LTWPSTLRAERAERERREAGRVPEGEGEEVGGGGVAGGGAAAQQEGAVERVLGEQVVGALAVQVAGEPGLAEVRARLGAGREEARAEARRGERVRLVVADELVERGQLLGVEQEKVLLAALEAGADAAVVRGARVPTSGGVGAGTGGRRD